MKAKTNKNPLNDEQQKIDRLLTSYKELLAVQKELLAVQQDLSKQNGFFVITVTGRMDWMNQEYLRDLRKSFRELTGQDCLILSEGADIQYCSLEKAKKKDKRL